MNLTQNHDTWSGCVWFCRNFTHHCFARCQAALMRLPCTQHFPDNHFLVHITQRDRSQYSFLESTTVTSIRHTETRLSHTHSFQTDPCTDSVIVQITVRTQLCFTACMRRAVPVDTQVVSTAGNTMLFVPKILPCRSGTSSHVSKGLTVPSASTLRQHVQMEVLGWECLRYSAASAAVVRC